MKTTFYFTLVDVDRSVVACIIIRIHIEMYHKSDFFHTQNNKSYAPLF